MQIRDVMRAGPFTVRDSDDLGTAYRAMMRTRVRHLPVMSEDKLIGMVSERDLLAARARAATDREWWKIPVRDAAVTPVLTAQPTEGVDAVAERMAKFRIGAMPIVDGDKLIGIVTATDLLGAEVREATRAPDTSALTAADVMTPWPMAVSPRTPLVDAVALMVDHHFRHLPVVDKATIVGMLSERDVRATAGDPAAFLRGRGNRPRLHVEDVMSRPAKVVVFDRSIPELAQLFADGEVGAVPVADRFGALIGIVSYVDVLRAIAG